jgi:hypothetical protein
MRDAELPEAISALDPELFDFIEAQTSNSDRRALLALHSAVGAKLGSFEYLEIGSYLGGSLQVLIRDPRCKGVVSIDSRPLRPPDKRIGDWSYDENSTDRMRSLLAAVPAADMSKLTSFDCGTEALTPRDLPGRPDLCFIDGEHTDRAVLRDARFCAGALSETGVIAFHDHVLVRPGIRAFLTEVWSEVSRAMVLSVGASHGGGVFALEVGDAGILDTPVVAKAVDSTWKRVAWRLASQPRRSPRAFFALWSSIPKLDSVIAEVRRRSPPEGDDIRSASGP